MKTKIVLALSVTLFGLLAFALIALPAPVQAAGPGVTAEATPLPWRQTLEAARPTQDGAELENLLVREKLALGNQQSRLSMSHTVAETTQSYIDNQKNAGKDTSALESALSAFNQAIVAAEADNNAAASLLASPAGFDASGQVVDRDTALKTVRDAGKSLRQAHLTITKGTLDLRMALQTYRGK